MQEILMTVITSAVVATVVGAAINAWLESRKSTWSTKLDALKTAVSLEGYAITCADKLTDHGTAVSSKGHAGSFMGGVPEFPELSVAVGFLKTKKASVANRLLVFPQEIYQAEQYVSGYWDCVGDPEGTREAAVEQVAKMGKQSLDLAKDIRSAFDLPNRELVFGQYSVHDVLEEYTKNDD
jgi:hypothetical protein